VSKRLAEILLKLVERPNCEDFPRRINCSWRWIRWFHPDHETTRLKWVEKTREIVERLRGPEGPPEEVEESKTQENLDKLVGRWPFRL